MLPADMRVSVDTDFVKSKLQDMPEYQKFRVELDPQSAKTPVDCDYVCCICLMVADGTQ